MNFLSIVLQCIVSLGAIAQRRVIAIFGPLLVFIYFGMFLSLPLYGSTLGELTRAGASLHEENGLLVFTKPIKRSLIDSADRELLFANPQYFSALFDDVRIARGALAWDPNPSLYAQRFRGAAVQFSEGPLKEVPTTGKYRFILIVTLRTTKSMLAHERIHIRDNFSPDFSFGNSWADNLANFSQSEVNAFEQGALPYRIKTEQLWNSALIEEYGYYLFHRTRLHLVRGKWLQALFDLTVLLSLTVLALGLYDATLLLAKYWLNFIPSRSRSSTPIRNCSRI